MKIKLIALSLCLFTGVNLVKAQEASKNCKHPIKYTL